MSSCFGMDYLITTSRLGMRTLRMVGCDDPSRKASIFMARVMHGKAAVSCVTVVHWLI